MKQVLLSLLRQFLFWILFFNLSRLVFIFYYFGLIRAGGAGWPEILMAFPSALKLDVAVACYFLILPFLILAIQSFGVASWLNTVNKAYTAVMAIAYSLAEAGEIGIYREWQTKLNYKALQYLSHPSEVYNSAETGTFFLLLLILLLLSAAGIFAYVRFFYRDVKDVKRNYVFIPAFILLTPVVLFIGCRGGVRPIPINQSESYYSKHEILNHAAVNNAFNLYVSIFENYRVMDKNPYVFMERKKAEEMVRAIYGAPPDTTVHVLTSTRPNIVLLILESYSADLIESLGGEPGITPEFRRLEKEGVLLTKIYASGMRSEQGMASIFAGFPAHPLSCSVIQPDKYHALPSLPAILKEQGYHTSFYFGGQLIYGNIKGYIYHNAFSKVVEGSDFPDSLPRGKLGIHDGYVLDYVAGEMGKQPQPFFTSVFTLSSHSPYDQPFEKPLKWGGSENDYINSAYYTDHCLGRFFEEVRKEPWYGNTLFILIADHSHSSYRNWYPGQAEYRHIPWLMTGGAIRPEYRGTTWSKLGNQHDLPATLLAQMDLPAGEFRWSRDLLNPYAKEFAWFSNENGYGWARPEIILSLDIGKDWIYSIYVPEHLKDSIQEEGEAYLQVLFDAYLSQ